MDNVNEVLKELEGAAIQTTAGSYVRVDHVKEVMERRAQEVVKEKERRLEGKSSPRNFKEANGRVRQDEEIMQHFPKPATPNLGKSVSAQPQPPSRA